LEWEGQKGWWAEFPDKPADLERLVNEWFCRGSDVCPGDQLDRELVTGPRDLSLLQADTAASSLLFISILGWENVEPLPA
jgi:hypothetical protein